VRTPILGAGRRVDGENVEFSRADQSALDHDRAHLEGRESLGVVGAKHLELANVLRVDLTEVRESLRGQGLVVAWPVSRGARRRRRGGWRCSGFEGRVLLRRHRTRRRVQREQDVAHLGPGYFRPGRVREIVGNPGADCGRADRNKRKNDVIEPTSHFRLFP
jgi:hypothetical protein